jgi:hypothetical protein
MKISLTAFTLLVLAFQCVSCSTEERDGRKYYGSSSPLQGKMGVQFKRLRSSSPAPAQTERTSDGSLLGSLGRDDSSEPPGLLDRNETPDEPGAEYWVHGQQSANPVQSRMGVRVSRRKK